MHACLIAHIEPLVADHVVFALTGSVLLREALFLTGIVLTLLGVIVQWQLPRRRMSMEEREKDGHITEAQARFRIRLHGVAAPSLTIAGAMLMVGMMWW